MQQRGVSDPASGDFAYELAGLDATEMGMDAYPEDESPESALAASA